ncbi:MAG: hypothetical protein ABFC79_04665 [Candidatus Cryosericum sp.]
MKKRARNILSALLVCCCSLAHAFLAGTLRATAASAQVVHTTPSPGHLVAMSSTGGSWQAVKTWIEGAAQTVGSSVGDAWTTVREFFTSGKAVAVVQSVTQSIDDTAVRLFLPFAQLLVPVLARMGLSATPELVAVWTFWIVVVLLLIILLLALRPRRAAPRKLPRVTSRTADQGQNAIEFGVVEQGPAPTAMPEQLEPAKREHAAAPVQEHAAGPAEETPHGPSVPEISLEPLGFFTGNHVGAPQPAAEAETPAVATSEPAPAELISPIVPPPEQPEVVPEIEVPPVQEALEPPPQEALQQAPEPELRPMGQEAPEVPEVPAEPAEIPLLEQTQPSATPEPAAQAETTMAEPAAAPETPPVEVSSAEIPSVELPSVEIPSVEVPAPSVEPPASETPEAPATQAVPVQPAATSGADLLSRLLEAEESFDQTVASPPVAPRPVPTAPAEPAATEPQQEGSMFGGDVDLDTLLRDGVVADAAALTQLFKGGYRSQISKLAVSAKDLQNVPTDVRNVMKLTVVALSPIELSIARDLAMRLEAPGFVGEALLVARKMGYENYLTTYRNISRNYKDVNIVETSSLKVPAAFHQPEDLISFS